MLSGNNSSNNTSVRVYHGHFRNTEHFSLGMQKCMWPSTETLTPVPADPDIKPALRFQHLLLLPPEFSLALCYLLSGSGWFCFTFLQDSLYALSLAVFPRRFVIYFPGHTHTVSYIHRPSPQAASGVNALNRQHTNLLKWIYCSRICLYVVDTQKEQIELRDWKMDYTLHPNSSNNKNPTSA